MDSLWVNILLVFLFFIIGGVFAAAEMAFVSLREPQIIALSSRGKRGAAVASLVANPNRFLSAVQIGVTLAGFLSASFGAATIGESFLSPWLQTTFGMAAGLASTTSTIAITLIVSFFSIVISELTAKRLAMQQAETFALALAPFVNLIAQLARPIIWALGASANVLVRVLGGDPNTSKESVSDAELRTMIINAESLGSEEKQILDDLFDAGNLNLREVMVPRTEVDFLAGDMPASKAMREVQGSSRSRYPVTNGSPDVIAGFVHVRDLMNLDPSDRSVLLREMARPVLSLPETVKILRALTAMRRANSHLAIVTDEYGGTAGIITLEDLVEELIGDITDEYDVLDDSAVHARPTQFEGLTTLEEFMDQTGFILPEGPYDTLAGYFMQQLGAVPTAGDRVEVSLVSERNSDESANFTMTVSEMDERRIDWINVVRTES